MDETSRSFHNLLQVFQNHAPEEMIGGMRMADWRRSIEESLSRRERMLEEQRVNPGLGGREVYNALAR